VTDVFMGAAIAGLADQVVFPKMKDSDSKTRLFIMISGQAAAVTFIARDLRPLFWDLALGDDPTGGMMFLVALTMQPELKKKVASFFGKMSMAVSAVPEVAPPSQEDNSKKGNAKKNA